MGRPAQGSGGWCRRDFPWFSLKVPLCLAACLALQACGTRGFSIEDAAPDRSIVTSSVSTTDAGATARAVTSDEATIRNAVSSAIVDEIGAGGLGWANAETGSRGAIRDVRETRDGARLCRSFLASRESFEGVHLYRGETCLGGARLWIMKSFARVE